LVVTSVGGRDSTSTVNLGIGTVQEAARNMPVAADNLLLDFARDAD
jgi:hypothetical protein